MVKKITVLVKRTGNFPVRLEIRNTARALNKLVGGVGSYVWYPELPDGVWVVCRCVFNRYETPIPNIELSDGVIYGDFILLSDDDNGVPASLSEKQLAECENFLARAAAGAFKNGPGFAGVYLCAP